MGKLSTDKGRGKTIRELVNLRGKIAFYKLVLRKELEKIAGGGRQVRGMYLRPQSFRSRCSWTDEEPACLLFFLLLSSKRAMQSRGGRGREGERGWGGEPSFSTEFSEKDLSSAWCGPHPGYSLQRDTQIASKLSFPGYKGLSDYVTRSGFSYLAGSSAPSVVGDDRFPISLPAPDDDECSLLDDFETPRTPGLSPSAHMHRRCIV